MLKKLMEDSDRNYVTLEDLHERKLAKTDPELFLQVHKPPILIDEVQYSPELFTYIKLYVDKHHTPGDFWLTSSYIFRLMRGIHESLAGRVAVLSLTSLSQSEINEIKMNPFEIDFDLLKERANERVIVDTSMIFKRIFKGSSADSCKCACLK